MRLAQVVELQAGGPGSGRHPEVASIKGNWQNAEEFLPIANLHTTEAYGKSEEVIKSYQKKIEAGEPIAPIKVQQWKNGAEVKDGHHRLEAARRAGLTHVGIVNEYLPINHRKNFKASSISANGSINWTSPSGPGPDQQDWFQYTVGLSPITNNHAPSLKNPVKTKIPLATDGWHQNDSDQAKSQAMKDLIEIHRKLRKQYGKPEVVQQAGYPLFPSLMNWQ